MPLEISDALLDSVTILTLKGTLVFGRDTELLTSKVEEVLTTGETHIILDLAQINFIDSSGIGALVRIYTAAERRGARVKLLRLTKRVHDVLQITRLSSVYEIYDDPQKAVASFGTGHQPSPG